PIVASIGDDTPAALTWSVRATRIGPNPQTILLAEGTGAVAGAPIATFDPTLLPNDSYRVRIEASDGIHASAIEFPCGVSGPFKLGNFEVPSSDLKLPPAGIPIEISRHYSSLDTSSKDFGNGWRLALPGELTDTAGEGPTEPFDGATKVYVTRSDGTRVGF